MPSRPVAAKRPPEGKEGQKRKNEERERIGWGLSGGAVVCGVEDEELNPPSEGLEPQNKTGRRGFSL